MSVSRRCVGFLLVVSQKTPAVRASDSKTHLAETTFVLVI